MRGYSCRAIDGFDANTPLRGAGFLSDSDSTSYRYRCVQKELGICEVECKDQMPRMVNVGLHCVACWRTRVMGLSSQSKALSELVPPNSAARDNSDKTSSKL